MVISLMIFFCSVSPHPNWLSSYVGSLGARYGVMWCVVAPGFRDWSTKLRGSNNEGKQDDAPPLPIDIYTPTLRTCSRSVRCVTSSSLAVANMTRIAASRSWAVAIGLNGRGGGALDLGHAWIEDARSCACRDSGGGGVNRRRESWV